MLWLSGTEAEMSVCKQDGHCADAFNTGLKIAALHLQRKAAKTRRPIEEYNSVSPNMMALIFEAEAKEILALCREG